MHRQPIIEAKHLEIVPLSESEWRICDGRADATDPLRVVGFIQRRPDGFEVLALTPAPEFRGLFARWGQAIEVLCGSSDLQVALDDAARHVAQRDTVLAGPAPDERERLT